MSRHKHCHPYLCHFPLGVYVRKKSVEILGSVRSFDRRQLSKIGNIFHPSSVLAETNCPGIPGPYVEQFKVKDLAGWTGAVFSVI